MTTAKYNCVTRSTVKVRNAPNTANTATQSMPTGTSFQISDIVPDSLDPTNVNKKWGVIFGGQYNGLFTALEYPGNISPISTYTLIETTPPVDPAPVAFPQSVVWEYVDSTGKTHRLNYVFERKLE